nr:hypothetical protein [Tanacetum cinerariifolium]
VVNDCMNVNCLNVDACEHCVTTESELQIDFINKEYYETLLKQYHSLEKHYISLEVNNQLNTKIFQRDTVSSSESAPTFAELFETNDLKAQIQEKDTVILKLKEKIKSSSGDVKERKVESKVEEIETQNLELDHKAQAKDTVILQLKEQLRSLKGDVTDRNVKREIEEIETLNIELGHKVTKLVVENEHLKQTYKQLKSKSVKTPVKRKVWKPTGNVFKTVGHIWKPTGRTFKIVGNVCPLTRIATPTIGPPRELIPIVNSMDKPVVTL